MAGNYVPRNNSVFCPMGTHLSLNSSTTSKTCWACSFCPKGEYIMGGGRLNFSSFHGNFAEIYGEACEECPDGTVCDDQGQPPKVKIGRCRTYVRWVFTEFSRQSVTFGVVLITRTYSIAQVKIYTSNLTPVTFDTYQTDPKYRMPARVL